MVCFTGDTRTANKLVFRIYLCWTQNDEHRLPQMFAASYLDDDERRLPWTAEFERHSNQTDTKMHKVYAAVSGKMAGTKGSWKEAAWKGVWLQYELHLMKLNRRLNRKNFHLNFGSERKHKSGDKVPELVLWPCGAWIATNFLQSTPVVLMLNIEFWMRNSCYNMCNTRCSILEIVEDCGMKLWGGRVAKIEGNTLW